MYIYGLKKISKKLMRHIKLSNSWQGPSPSFTIFSKLAMTSTFGRPCRTPALSGPAGQNRQTFWRFLLVKWCNHRNISPWPNSWWLWQLDMLWATSLNLCSTCSIVLVVFYSCAYDVTPYLKHPQSNPAVGHSHLSFGTCHDSDEDFLQKAETRPFWDSLPVRWLQLRYSLVMTTVTVCYRKWP